jgi:hypothetical protein
MYFNVKNIYQTMFLYLPKVPLLKHPLRSLSGTETVLQESHLSNLIGHFKRGTFCRSEYKDGFQILKMNWLFADYRIEQNINTTLEKYFKIFISQLMHVNP